MCTDVLDSDIVDSDDMYRIYDEIVVSRGMHWAEIGIDDFSRTHDVDMASSAEIRRIVSSLEHIERTRTSMWIHTAMRVMDALEAILLCAPNGATRAGSGQMEVRYA